MEGLVLDNETTESIISKFTFPDTPVAAYRNPIDFEINPVFRYVQYNRPEPGDTATINTESGEIKLESLNELASTSATSPPASYVSLKCINLRDKQVLVVCSQDQLYVTVEDVMRVY